MAAYLSNRPSGSSAFRLSTTPVSLPRALALDRKKLVHFRPSAGCATPFSNFSLIQQFSHAGIKRNRLPLAANLTNEAAGLLKRVPEGRASIAIENNPASGAGVPLTDPLQSGILRCAPGP